MNGHAPADDDEWYASARNETRTERLDRNWSSLLQELRVVQTGVQVLTGFLLTLPFQSRFDSLETWEKLIYLTTVVSSIAATAFLVAPVGMHRLLFRRHRLDQLVATAHFCAIVGLLLLGLTLIGVVALIFATVVGPVAAVVFAACVAALLTAFWLVIPLIARKRRIVTGRITGLRPD
ncbi:MAG: hypothetical protein ICV72_07390 [Aldersonia sp.]|nr:hypothetical protein [Aldersonia sp.]